MSLGGGGFNAQAVKEQQARQQECMNGALLSGCRAGATALCVSGGLCAGLLKYSAFFKSHFTVGAKASFIMLPTFYSFWWASEKSVARCSLDGSRHRFRRAQGAATAAAEAAAAAGEQ